MEEFRDFQGKTLDAAILEACSYYNTAREKLEIEIIQDAKSGIFGLVGSQKAQVRARRALIDNSFSFSSQARSSQAISSQTGSDQTISGQANTKIASKAEAKHKHSPKIEFSQTKEEQELRIDKAEAKSEQKGEHKEQARHSHSKHEHKAHHGRDRRHESKKQEVATKNSSTNKANKDAYGKNADQDAYDHEKARLEANAAATTRLATNPMSQEDLSMACTDLTNTEDNEYFLEDESENSRTFSKDDLEYLANKAKENILLLAKPIAGAKVTIESAIEPDCIKISLDNLEDSALLIGREGQTLAALQYLVGRMLSREMQAAVHLQIDAASYRQRQDERLRSMALHLAERVRITGHSHTTRPLSSWHRRVIHITLQNDNEIQTRSSGEGHLKRVVIMRRRDR